VNGVLLENDSNTCYARGKCMYVRTRARVCV